MELEAWIRKHAPWMLESNEERARRVCREADHLQVMRELELRWRFLLGEEPVNTQFHEDGEDTVTLRPQRRLACGG